MPALRIKYQTSELSGVYIKNTSLTLKLPVDITATLMEWRREILWSTSKGAQKAFNQQTRKQQTGRKYSQCTHLE